MSVVQQQQMMILAAACDDAGNTTSLFIVSSPTQIKPVDTASINTEIFHDCVELDNSAPLKPSNTGSGPKKGILKPAKAISYEALASLPPPIQRSARLSPRELRRLTPLPPSPPPSQTTFNSKRRVHFSASPVLTIHDAYSTDEYNRGACEFAAKALTPQLAMQIKKELNEAKQEMEVHEESREFTQFYKL